MKIASNAEIAILSGGKYIPVDMYDFTLSTGATSHFTGADFPFSAAIATSPTTFASSNQYLTGYTIERGSTTQTVGLDTQEMDLTIVPQWDAPGGPPTIGGYTILQAAQLGLLDNMSVLYSKMFLLNVSDTSPGAMAWFQGVVAEMDIDRFKLEMKISSNIIVLNQVQMPKNLYQAICSHTVYDAGCAILKSSFTSTGALTSVTSGSQFACTTLAQADNYFNLGVIKFTSGANNGLSTTVKSFLHTGGVIQTVVPFPVPPAPGDTFSIYPGCDLSKATCASKFANAIHFKGFPFIPVPETLYDGGTSAPQNGTNNGGGGQGPSIGSGPGGRLKS